jgi:NADH-quinone oxidoreductase subunit J
MIQALAFYIFAGVTILSGAMTISSRNPVHSVLWLILAFFNAAGLMVLVGAEFIVYVGAVAVLFLFVVMMLDIDFAELRAGFVRYLWIGLALAVALVSEILIGVGAWSAGGVNLARRAAPIDPSVSNIQAIGDLLYTRYLFVFEAAGFVLLVAMIGAIVLTHRQRSGIRPQNIARQVARRPQDATRNTRPEIGQGVSL